jgi:hypothetical protein
MPTTARSLRLAVLATAGALALSAPAFGQGGTGGGGGGTPAPAPAPVTNDAPCASLQGPGAIAPESTKANVVFSYKLTNCSPADESYVFSISGVQTSGNVPTPCATATTTLPAMTLRARDARGFSVEAPNGVVGGCRIGFGQYHYTATIADAVTGAVLATQTTDVMRMGGV